MKITDTTFSSRDSLPVRVEDGVLSPVPGVALVGRQQGAHVVDVDAVGLEHNAKFLNEIVHRRQHRDPLFVHRRAASPTIWQSTGPKHRRYSGPCSWRNGWPSAELSRNAVVAQLRVHGWVRACLGLALCHKLEFLNRVQVRCSYNRHYWQLAMPAWCAEPMAD